MYPTTPQADYEAAQSELDTAIARLKSEARLLETAIKDARTPRVLKLRAKAGRGIWVTSLAFGGFMTFLIGGAYAHIYVEPLRQFWYIWPSVGVAADTLKLGLIWVACIAVAMAARAMRRRALRAAVARLDKGIEDL